MLNLAKPLNLNMGAYAGKAGPPPDPVIQMLAHRVYGPGYNGGGAPSTANGSPVNYSGTFTNDSGAVIAKCSVALQGWTLRTTGTTDMNNPYDVSGTIEYPVGTVVGTIPATTVNPGDNVASSEITLSASIPKSGSFKVNLTATPVSGKTYIQNLGFAGLRNHALKSTLAKIAMAGFGDSIMTNNGGSIYNVALGRCPCYLNSITGTTAATYGASGAANFVKQVAAAKLLGITHIMSNFGTNDFGGSTPVITLQGYLGSMKTLANNNGMKFVQMTMLPRVAQLPNVTPSSVTSVGNNMFVVVPDASLFTVGHPIGVGGMTPSEYNGAFIVTAIDTGTNTLTILFPGSATSPATGASMVIAPWKYTFDPDFMVPLMSQFQPGPDSARGQFNAWVRAGAFDDYVEWGDACEPTRDAGRWKVMGEDALLPSVQTINVTQVINTSRFNSNYSAGSSTIPNGFVLPKTGANIGLSRGGNGNTNGDITVTASWPNAQVVGDQYYAVPGCSYMSDDGTHPRQGAGGKGGQSILDAATLAWLTSKL